MLERTVTKDFAIAVVLRSEDGRIQYIRDTELYFGNHDVEILFKYPYWMIVVCLMVPSAYFLLKKL